MCIRDRFHTEAALVRPQITCGTHALALALMSNLRPGDELLSPVGKPYDTLEEVIGIRESRGSLKEYGISYRQVDLKEDGSFDWEGIRNAIHPNTKLATIQRSKGYQTRPTLSVEPVSYTHLCAGGSSGNCTQTGRTPAGPDPYCPCGRSKRTGCFSRHRKAVQ